MTDEQLFQVLTEMLNELKDGHVNLFSPFNIGRYSRWHDAFPTNFSDSLQRIYLGKSNEHKVTSYMQYKIFTDNVGYIRCGTFDASFGGGNIQAMMKYLSLCRGLIVDVRNNGGGMLTSAEKLASVFTNRRIIACYIQHKTGKGHQDFSPLEPIYLNPFEGLRWQKPLVILANRRTFSAANSFVMYLKGLPNVTVIGDKTGGGAGLPFSSDLPNGWSMRFSACPMFDRQKQCTEEGIEPDIKANITSADYRKGIDTIIEEAKKYLERH